MDPVTAVDVGSQEPWREGPPRRRRLFIVLLLIGAAVAAVAAVAVLRFVEQRAADDAPYDDEKKLRDRAIHPPVAIVAPKDINLPEVSGGVTIPPEDLVLTVSKTMVSLEGQDIVPVPADARRGFELKYKRSGITDLYVQPLAMVMGGWALKYPPMVGRPAFMTLLVDRDVPYRLLMEIMFTLGQSEWSGFHLGASHAGKLVATDSRPPRAVAGRPSAECGVLGLTVLVVADGFSIKARGGNIAPGCQDVGAGLAIPKIAAGYDYAGLRACAAKLKSAAPEYAAEKQAIVSASSDMPYGTIVTTVDTLQADELFPDVTFGVAR